MIATSRTVRPIGPGWSSEEAKATTPQREHRPYVGFAPTFPKSLPGGGIGPPLSVPVAASAARAATAAAEPPDEPPGTRGRLSPRRRHGFSTGPYQLVVFDEPIANSSRLVFPSMTPPDCHSLSVTVDS